MGSLMMAINFSPESLAELSSLADKMSLPPPEDSDENQNALYEKVVELCLVWFHDLLELSIRGDLFTLNKNQEIEPLINLLPQKVPPIHDGNSKYIPLPFCFNDKTRALIKDISAILGSETRDSINDVLARAVEVTKRSMKMIDGGSLFYEKTDGGFTQAEFPFSRNTPASR